MRLRLAGLLLAIAMLAVLAYGLYLRDRYPREVVGTGSVRIESGKRPELGATLQTRRLRAGPMSFEEVRLPGGTWIDCAGDCRKAALESGPDFWDALARDRGR
jgi:hypothetical protein